MSITITDADRLPADRDARIRESVAARSIAALLQVEGVEPAAVVDVARRIIAACEVG